MIFTEGSELCVDFCESCEGTRSGYRRGVGMIFKVLCDIFFVEHVFTVDESFVNVCTLRINVLNDMFTAGLVHCEFVIVQFNKTRPYTYIVMVLFLLNLERNKIEGPIEGTTGFLVWYVESTYTLNIVQFIVNCARPVNDRINCIHDEDLRVGGNN